MGLYIYICILFWTFLKEASDIQGDPPMLLLVKTRSNLAPKCIGNISDKAVKQNVYFTGGTSYIEML
jgi:hypothetical protein